MQLPSRLSLATLGDVLGMLLRARATGKLELCEIHGRVGNSVPGRLHAIHLWSGLPASVETALPVAKLGEILHRQGYLSEQSLRRFVTELRSEECRSTGAILTAHGLVDEPAVLAGLRCQLRARIEVLFGLRDAKLSFHTARPDGHSLRCPPLGASDFLVGRPRARDRQAQPRDAGTRPWPSPPPGRRSSSRETATYGDDPVARARRMLRVPAEAGADEIRRAFRRLAATMHPDRLGPSSGDVQRLRAAEFAQLSAAYHLLVA